MDLSPDEQSRRSGPRSGRGWWATCRGSTASASRRARGPRRRGALRSGVAGEAGRGPVGRGVVAEAYGGRGAGPVEHYIVQDELARARAPEFVGRIGINLAGPTLMAHGTEEQKLRWLPRILARRRDVVPALQRARRGQRPRQRVPRRPPRSTAAGRSTARRCGRRYAQFADWGVCLARTDPTRPKHKGISSLVVDMRAPGVEVRPLVQLTGEAEFNEVFFDDVFVPADQLIGPRTTGLAGGQLHPVARAGHQPPPARHPHPAARGAAPARRRQRRARRSPPPAAPGRGLRRGPAVPAPQPAQHQPAVQGSRPRSRGQRAQALLERDEQAPPRHRHGGPRRRRPAVARCRRTTRAAANGSARGSTTRRRRCGPGRTRSSAPSSASVCSASPAAKATVSERVTTEREDWDRPLEGIRVIDVGTRISAPFCAGLLGDMGAEVIKIEDPRAATSAHHRSVRADRRRRPRLLDVVGGRGTGPQGRHPETCAARGPGPVPPPRRHRRCGVRELPARGRGALAHRARGLRSPTGVGPHHRVRPGRSLLRSDGPRPHGHRVRRAAEPDRLPGPPPVRPGVSISDYLTGRSPPRRCSPPSTAATARAGPARGGVVDAAALRLDPPGARVDHAGPGPARHRAPPRGQPHGELGAARQLPDQGRHLRLHRRGIQRELPPAVCRDGSSRAGRRPAWASLAQRAARSDEINDLVADWTCH